MIRSYINTHTDMTGFGVDGIERGKTCSIVHTAGECSMVYPYDPTLELFGISLNDVVHIDLTRQHLNYHINNVQNGGKIQVMTDGSFVSQHLWHFTKGQELTIDLDGEFIPRQYNHQTLYARALADSNDLWCNIKFSAGGLC